MSKWTQRRRELEEAQNLGFKTPTDNSDYQRDRARVIHSSAFRRLQSKTQVLGVGESDFYRTRLTHSLEAAQIGSGICENLKTRHKEYKEYTDLIPSLHLIEAICLLHDIGHPPFGHGGEVALNRSMAHDGGFEGNGQTLRIASKLGEYSPEEGLNLTRRTMLGVLKYPSCYSHVVNEECYNSSLDPSTTNIDNWKPPKCIFDDEKDILDWILEPFSSQDKETFQEVERKEKKHAKPRYKSFDASIMELADDIAYGVHDLEDSLALSLIKRREWDEEVVSQIVDMDDCKIKQEIDWYSEHLFSESNKERKQAVSSLVRFFISNTRIIEPVSFEDPLLRYQATIDSPAQKILKIFKDFVFEKVIKRPEVQVLEFKGQQMILKIFEVLQDNPKRLLPSSTYQKYSEALNQKRVICDYISGMTDSYATKLYHRLFSPDVGSIFDRL